MEQEVSLPDPDGMRAHFISPTPAYSRAGHQGGAAIHTTVPHVIKKPRSPASWEVYCVHLSVCVTQTFHHMEVRGTDTAGPIPLPSPCIQ